MKNQHFIESGILESYLLGMATQEEEHTVNQMMMTHADVSEYMGLLEENVQSYFRKVAVPPPTNVREVIQFRTGRTDIQKKAKPDFYNIPADEAPKKDEYLDIEVNDTYIKVHKWWRPAFIAVFVLSKIFLIAGLYYYFKASSQEQEIEKLKTEIAHPLR